MVHFIKSESGKSSLQMDGHGIGASILLYTLACHDSEMLLGNVHTSMLESRRESHIFKLNFMCVLQKVVVCTFENI